MGLEDSTCCQVISKDKRNFFENSGAIEGDFKTYLKRMKDPSFYGGEPELLALSDGMEVSIKVYMYEPVRDNGSC